MTYLRQMSKINDILDFNMLSNDTFVLVRESAIELYLIQNPDYGRLAYSSVYMMDN